MGRRGHLQGAERFPKDAFMIVAYPRGGWCQLSTIAFAELLIDCEEDRVLRAVLVGMLREGDR